MEWIKKAWKWIAGAIGAFTTLYGFFSLLRGNYYLGFTVLGIVIFGAAIVFLLYVAFAKSESQVQPGTYKYTHERFRTWALAGIGIVIIVLVLILIARPSRSFVVTAIVGTATPTPTPTATSTPTMTPTLTPTPPVVAEMLFEDVTTSSGEVVRKASLYVEDLGYGKYYVEWPGSILYDETFPITLYIIPDSIIAEKAAKSRINLVVDGGFDELSEDAILGNISEQEILSNPEYSFNITDQVKVYPVMTADLFGLDFTIEPIGPRTKIVTYQAATQWSWIVKPRDSGNSLLYVSVSIPVNVGSNTELVESTIANIPIEIEVIPPAETSPPYDGYAGFMVFSCVPYLIVLVIIAIISLSMLGARASDQRREKIISLLRSLKDEESPEIRSYIEAEIYRLVSINWWQFWRRD